ncbi:MAG: pyridoxal phosphate-dependent aminotransferase [Deltaproteobacteria bacterium]|nr:pyridoxal phosphate-dependent aminotransferase [Deltaproteobacteria bacterium]
MKLSTLVTNIPASPTLTITAKVQELKSQGQDIIGFGAGEPDFDTPDHIKEAAIEALNKGKTKYTPVGGTVALKEAVCERIRTDYALSYKPENVIISCGAKHSLYNLFLTLFEQGDEVICPAPYWVSYPPMIEIAGGTPVFIDTTKTGMKLLADQVEAAISNKTRGIIINSPSNPTGMLFDRQELEAIAELCVKHDIQIISDDIYQKLIYDEAEFFNVATISPEVAEKTFIIQGVSKTYAMTGWRIGYCIGNPDVIKAMTRLQSQSTSNPTTFSQEGTIAALMGDQSLVEERRGIFEKRRNLIVDKINDIPGFELITPQGAFYTFPSIQGHMDRFGSASRLAEFLLENAHVAVVPGEGFGSKTHFRLSFAMSEKAIVEGLDRIKQALNT